MSTRDLELIEQHRRGARAGKLAATYGIPVSRVWRILARHWMARARHWMARAQQWEQRAGQLEQELLEAQATPCPPQQHWTLRQQHRVLEIVREPSLARRLELVQLSFDEPIPVKPVAVLDLRTHDAS